MGFVTEEAFSEKYELYSKMIYKIAYGYTKSVQNSEDITQNVFLKYLKADKVFKTIDDERYWLIRVTINESINFLKTAYNKNVVLDDDYISNTKEIVEEKQESINVLEYVEHLPDKYKSVILLFYYNDMKIDEISKTLKLSEAAVKKRLERGRNMLRERIEDHE